MLPKSLLFAVVLFGLAIQPESIAQAGIIYDFRFTTDASLGNTGVDGEVKGYFHVPDPSGVINNLTDALTIDQLVITSDTSGTGFAPLNTNLFTYSDAIYSGWELLSYNGMQADGTSVTGSVIFSGVSGGGKGGLRSALTIGRFASDALQRVGSITFNPDGGVNMGNRKYATGSLLRGNTIEFSVASSAVPEPSTFFLFAVAGLSPIFTRRRRDSWQESH